MIHYLYYYLTAASCERHVSSRSLFLHLRFLIYFYSLKFLMKIVMHKLLKHIVKVDLYWKMFIL